MSRALLSQPRPWTTPLEGADMPNATPIEDRFWTKTEWRDGCLVWTGHCTGGGYGRTFMQGRQEYAHRVAFWLTHNRWPEPGMVLRHLCNNPACVVHVVEGSQQENIRDSLNAGTQAQARKTHCPQGHPYDDENTYRDGRGRRCRACNRARLKARKAA